MNTLVFLNSQDYTVVDNYLTQPISGFSFVLFFTKHCEYCRYTFPIFKSLLQHVNGCFFAVTDLTYNLDLREKSQGTTTPINVVPYLILYTDGVPFARYSGEYNKSDMTQFIIDACKIISQETSKQETMKRLQQSTFLHYLMFDEAYK